MASDLVPQTLRLFGRNPGISEAGLVVLLAKKHRRISAEDLQAACKSALALAQAAVRIIEANPSDPLVSLPVDEALRLACPGLSDEAYVAAAYEFWRLAR